MSKPLPELEDVDIWNENMWVLIRSGMKANEPLAWLHISTLAQSGDKVIEVIASELIAIVGQPSHGFGLATYRMLRFKIESQEKALSVLSMNEDSCSMVVENRELGIRQAALKLTDEHRQEIQGKVLLFASRWFERNVLPKDKDFVH